MEQRPFRSLMVLLLGLAALLGLFSFQEQPNQAALSWAKTPVGKRSLVFQADINQATLQELTALPGIGPSIAQRLLDYRQAVGYIYDLDELKYVKGLYLAHERLKDHLYVDTIAVNRFLANEQTIPHQPSYDLNTVDSLTLVRNFRLAPALVKRMLHFRTAIGGFQSWATIEKTWGLTPRDKVRLHRYGFLSAKTQNTFAGVQLNLNTASEQELEALPHIGPVLAARIVKFRAALGFFANTQQLYEVYGLDSLAVQELLPRFYVNQAKLNQAKRLDVNQAVWETLYAHPYLRNRAIARRIVNYRNKYGSYRSLDDLLQVYDFTPEMLAKLRPYLTIGSDTINVH
jgi:DNA uptake protein ComE-like DNA-binding protein